MNILIFFIILLVLVLVHEFGHFFTAKKFGIRVDEFGFGFPPKLFGVKRGETEYTFNLLPLGGFVKIFGENPDEENTSGPDAARSFVNKPKWQQAIVLFAGVFANFLLAWLLFSIGFMSGLPTSVGSSLSGYELKDVNLVIVSVTPDSPAEGAGLQSGDIILSVSDYTYAATPNDAELGQILSSPQLNSESLKQFVVSHPDKKIYIIYKRDNLTNMAEVIPQANNNSPFIGISMDQIGIAKLPVLAAFKEGMSLTLSLTKNTAFGLYRLISQGLVGKGSLATITGPVGMVGIVGDAYEFGFIYLLSFAAIISINLAIINLIPFPALDGGRLLFLLIEKIKGSALNSRIVNAVNTIGFIILILLMVLVTYHDIVKLL